MTTGLSLGYEPVISAEPVGGGAPAVETEAAADRGLLIRRIVGAVITGIGVLIVMLLLYLFAFTPLTHARNQHQLLSTLTGDPKTAFALVRGQVPPEGNPVGILEIRSLHVSQAVIEGTSAADLESGPGHMPGTVLPGLAGNSVIAGRRTTFGGPFSAIGSLHRGAIIRVSGRSGG